MTIARRRIWAAAAIPLATAVVLLTMGRPPICRCGTVAIWHGVMDEGNSQQLLDWYSFGHVLHGVLFYAAAALLMPRRRIGDRMLAALAVECGWELIENTPLVIDRYRTATMALGYSGDSVLNSLGDIGCMAVGFLLAWWLAVRAVVAMAIGFEMLTLAAIRDNLTLNVLMLVHPIAAVARWQAGASAPAGRALVPVRP